MASISSLSLEYILVPVTFTVAGTVTDPTGDVVSLAFVKPGVDPIVGDWVTGSWESDVTTPTKPIRYARALVGPGSSKVLAKGPYITWVKVADTPETPAKPAGLLSVE